eukprot:CAMPEP_0198334274 /NCGR_PEP_ID=MMETSP1450-20131203/19511_1 /TAXON_ID=753684 ORGANISM="Madagascaria erythrocladiodes, Strain CCMP3234" /NCGR_SAMPLE_ID=MMETSP1450 /ASSEMBLY_ACC=CAM_ASM_001115 /LENGTH=99 /DNA_ID=CAMNT_0044038855 /DNA_START=84 /DNA_END=380 /DNA_ORIENTATION=-
MSAQAALPAEDLTVRFRRDGEGTAHAFVYEVEAGWDPTIDDVIDYVISDLKTKGVTVTRADVKKYSVIDGNDNTIGPTLWRYTKVRSTGFVITIVADNY